MQHKYRVLVIDDEPYTLEALQLLLVEAGFEPIAAQDALSGIRAAYHTHPDAILLDVTMPDMDGFEACRRLRKITSAPILFVTGTATDPQDLTQGFAVGADDFVTKPFNRQELISRLTASLRRAVRQREHKANYLSPAPSIILDCDRHELILSDQSIYLSPKEFEILQLLMRHAGQTISRDAIIAQVWGPERLGEGNLVKQYIHQLRRKIEPDPGEPSYIRSDWGEGYWFQASEGSTVLKRS